MIHFQSKVRSDSAQFSTNSVEMMALIDHLRELESRAVARSNKRRPVFEKRGQIPPHERIARLLDPGMPFLRLHTLANYLVEDENPETSLPGGSIISGIGFCEGCALRDLGG